MKRLIVMVIAVAAVSMGCDQAPAQIGAVQEQTQAVSASGNTIAISYYFSSPAAGLAHCSLAKTATTADLAAFERAYKNNQDLAFCSYRETDLGVSIVCGDQNCSGISTSKAPNGSITVEHICTALPLVAPFSCAWGA